MTHETDRNKMLFVLIHRFYLFGIIYLLHITGKKTAFEKD